MHDSAASSGHKISPNRSVYLIPIIILCTRPIIILHVRDMRKICIPIIVDNILNRYTHHRHYTTQTDAETFDVLRSRVYVHIRWHRYHRLRLESKTTIIYYIILYTLCTILIVYAYNTHNCAAHIHCVPIYIIIL